MATIVVQGRPLNESAGQDWHLIGKVASVPGRPNELILLRSRDGLSTTISRAFRQLIPRLRITDTSGKSAALTQVRLWPCLKSLPFRTEGGHQGAQTAHESVRIAFAYQKIDVMGFRRNASDDWA